MTPPLALAIPAYQPADDLAGVVRGVVAADASAFRRILVVDDGSDEAYRRRFEDARSAGASVMRRERNGGKGAALKSAIEALLAPDAELAGIVTADADGQHAPADIVAVARALARDPDAIVIGVRAFDGAVPRRSRFGNALTRVVFHWKTGIRVSDTQTGLRGWPRAWCRRLLSIPGDRYEFESLALLEALRSGDRLVEVPIATIYADGNRSSHFRPLRDSARVYAAILAK